MASVLGLERSQTGAADRYDHAINLIDSTNKPAVDDTADDGDLTTEATLDAIDGERPRHSRQLSGGSHLRRKIARRNYSKYKEEVEEAEQEPRSPLQKDGETPENSGSSSKPVKQGTFGTTGRLRDKIPFTPFKRRQSNIKSTDTTFIDVLYENQRGSFFCGIPLYSANSLLNFDPSGWQTATFRDSPVDISNAQVPDPSWAWEWPSWYVDMSHDVDEDGWEYSFSFSPNFAWHGSHPWFHSFCRRRRWLRKRVKHAHHGGMKEIKTGIDAHILAADYFTIHSPTRGGSRSTSGDRNATRRSSTLAGYQNAEEEDEEEHPEISNINVLMTAVKRGRVDREKSTAVSAFLAQGGDELFYLAENIPTIMEDFIYQTSRRQFQTTLLKTLDDTLSTPASPEAQEAHHRRIQNLLHAIAAAGVHTVDQDYWHTLQEKAKGEDIEPTTVAEHSNALEGASKADVGVRDDITAHIEDEAGLDDEIRGISKDAEISVAPGIRRPNTETGEVAGGGDGEKGKGKEKA